MIATRPASALAPGAGAYLALCAAPMLWAGNFVVGRLENTSTDPLTLNFLRWALVSLLLCPVLAARRQEVLGALRAFPGRVLVLSALGILGFNTLLYAGLAHSGAGEAGVLFGLVPLMIVGVAGLWGGSAAAVRVAFGAALALGGVAFIVLTPSSGTQERSLWGPALVLAAGLVWALYTVALKRLPLGIPAMPTLALTSVVGTGMMVPLLPWMDVPGALAQPGLALSVGYLAVGASILAFCLWQRGVQAVGASRAGVFLHLIPAFGVVLGALFLGEAVTPETLTGLGLILLGVGVAQGLGANPQHGRAASKAKVA